MTPSRKVIRNALAAGVVVVAAVLLITHKTTYPHTIQVTVPEAFEVISGERMVQAGETVGSIISANVTRNAEAHIVMGLDNDAWPLPKDSTLYLRMGGTIKFTDRYIEIQRGRANTDFTADESVPAKQFVAPVEYDTVFNIFNAKTRTGLKSFVDNAGASLSRAAPALRKALDVAAPAVSQADAVFRDLDDQQRSLTTLLRSTSDVSDAVAESNPGMRTLLSGAASTFGSLASESASLQRAITAAPPALSAASRAATHVSHTLATLTPLAERLSPGVTQLNELADPLNTTLKEVVDIKPAAVNTLDTVKTAAPSLVSLLGDARTKLMPEVQSVSRQAARQLECIRPYTPDIISVIQTWGSFLGDGLTTPHLHFFQAEISTFPFPNDMPINTTQLTQLFPDLDNSRFPEPPGESWNQPWYQPQCNTTAASTSPAADTENNTFDASGAKAIDYPSSSS